MKTPLIKPEIKRALSIVVLLLGAAVSTRASETNPDNLKAAAPISFSESVLEAEAREITAIPADQWKPISMNAMTGGSAISTSTAGASLEYEFSGAAAAADIMVGKSGGIMAITVDGAPVAEIDLYRNRMDPGMERIALANNLAPGIHKLRLVALGTKHPKSLGTLVAIDTIRTADAPYASISGTLECRYNTGMPVLRAKVRTAGKDVAINLVTGADGTFAFSALPPGDYLIGFERRGFTPLEKNVISLSAGKKLNLGTVLLEENIGARPLTHIRYPIGTRPVIVRPGDEIPVEVKAPNSASGWNASIETKWSSSPLEFKNASFNNAAGRWTVTFTVPNGVPSFLYGLRLKFDGGEDFQPRAVMIVAAFKDSIKVVHLTDVHVYKSELLFDVYPRLADEINLINPDVIVVTGDLTDSCGYTDDRWPESDQYPPMLDLWNSYNSPTFILPGNHDLSPFRYEDDYLRWNRFFDVTDFSFDVGPYHFIAFDNAFTMVSSARDEAHREDLFPEQLEWIDNELSRNSGAKMNILLFHVPLRYSDSKVKELAEKHKVKLALYGHNHMNQIDKLSPTTYVQTGAAYDGFYRVVNLDDGKVGDMGAKKDGIISFAAGALKFIEEKTDGGAQVSLKVKNTTTMAIPGAAWRAEIPAASSYSCDGCSIASSFVNGDKALVVFTFDIPPKGVTTTVLKAE